MATEQSAANGRAAVDTTEQKFTYDQWMQSVGIPVHKGFFIPDTRTMELGWWEARQCPAARHQHPAHRRLPDPPAVSLRSLTDDGLTSASSITTISRAGRSFLTVTSRQLSVKRYPKIQPTMTSRPGQLLWWSGSQ